MEYVSEHPITVFHVKDMMVLAVRSNLDTALYSMVVKGHALLNISLNPEICASGVIQETASVRGRIVMV